MPTSPHWAGQRREGAQGLPRRCRRARAGSPAMTRRPAASGTSAWPGRAECRSSIETRWSVSNFQPASRSVSAANSRHDRQVVGQLGIGVVQFDPLARKACLNCTRATPRRRCRRTSRRSGAGRTCASRRRCRRNHAATLRDPWPPPPGYAVSPPPSAGGAPPPRTPTRLRGIPNRRWDSRGGRDQLPGRGDVVRCPRRLGAAVTLPDAIDEGGHASSFMRAVRIHGSSTAIRTSGPDPTPKGSASPLWS